MDECIPMAINGNLLIKIHNFRPRENTTPKENFFTEILTFVLNNDKELLSKFCALFEYKKSVEGFKVSSQVPKEGKRKRVIDLEISKERSISFFIESKIDTPLDNNQLENYLQIQKKKRRTIDRYQGYVVLLTHNYERAYGEIENNEFFKHIYWDDVFKIINGHKNTSKSEIINFLINEFVKLMEYENMNQIKKVEKESMEQSVNFFVNIKRLFRFIQMELKLKGQSGKKPEMSFSISDKKYAKINLVFYINTIKCMMRCKLKDGADDINFYLRIKRKKLGMAQDEKLRNYGFSRKGDKYLSLSYPKNKEFFDYDAEKQQKTITQFYLKNIEYLRKIL